MRQHDTRSEAAVYENKDGTKARRTNFLPKSPALVATAGREIQMVGTEKMEQSARLQTVTKSDVREQVLGKGMK